MTSSTLATIEFGPLTIRYDHRVLTPRPWTTMQSKWAADLLRTLPDGPVLELCTGAGQIGLLTVALHPRPAVLVDLDPVACEFARVNVEHAGLEDVEVREAPLESALSPDERFGLVLADPPYLTTTGTGRFPRDPLLAIDGGPDGLDVVRRCLYVADSCLEPGGAVLLQLADASQADAVAAWLTTVGTPCLRVDEVRTHERGAVALLRRPTDHPSTRTER